MVKTTIGEYLPISPITLPCPFCGAKPGHDCETPSEVYLRAVHVARVKAAAKMDKEDRKVS
jgi:hypothetical protein